MVPVFQCTDHHLYFNVNKRETAESLFYLISVRHKGINLSVLSPHSLCDNLHSVLLKQSFIRVSFATVRKLKQKKNTCTYSKGDLNQISWWSWSNLSLDPHCLWSSVSFQPWSASSLTKRNIYYSGWVNIICFLLMSTWACFSFW